MQQVSKTLLAKQTPVVARSALLISQTSQFSEQASNKPQLTMAEEETKHRMKLPLYDLNPRVENCWVAPNSTIGKSLDNTIHLSSISYEVGLLLCVIRSI